jgi:molybdopterin synthase catalytic subunit
MDKVTIQTADFDLTSEVNLLRSSASSSNIGAIVSFVGLVRDLEDTKIKKMSLEHYPGMTEKSLYGIIERARRRFPIGDTTIIHRVGDLKRTENIVLVITTSKHRGAAFEACEFIMDYLKTQAPFWKREFSEDGDFWVEANEKDEIKAKKWQENTGDY